MSRGLNRRFRLARASRGFSLIEALVALVVLSVGLLGIAALYVTSVSSGRTATLRTHAVMLAADLADRIRANRLAGLAYDDATSGAGAFTAACQPGGAGGGGCPPATMANEDKAEWLALVAARLPGAVPTVTVVGPLPNTYTITLAWVEPGIGNQGYTLSFQT